MLGRAPAAVLAEPADFDASARSGATTYAYARSARSVAYAVLAAVFTVPGAVLATAPDLAERVMAGLALLAALAAALACVRAWRMRDVPIVTFDPQGVRFRGPFVEQFLAWSELEGAYVVQHHRRFHVALVPKDLAAVLAAAPGLRRRWLLSNVGTIGAPFALPQTDVPVRRLFALLRAYATFYGDVAGPGGDGRAGLQAGPPATS